MIIYNYCIVNIYIISNLFYSIYVLFNYITKYITCNNLLPIYMKM